MSKELAEELRDIADMTNWEAMILEAADLIESQQKRIEQLELTPPDKREDLRCVISDICLQVRERDAQLAAAQAQLVKMREAVKEAFDGWHYDRAELPLCVYDAMKYQPTDDSALRELLKAERDRCADLVFDMVQEERNNYCWSVLHEAQSAIRAMGDQ